VILADNLTAIPAPFDFPAAAAFGVAYTTAYHSLRSIAEVRAGDWVVVLGAAGGVGLAAVDLAQLLGGRVVAAASTPDKLALCQSRGATGVVAYRSENLRDRIRELTGGGADVVIDPVGGPWAESALRALRWGGRFVTVGYASGEIPRIPLNLVLLKGVILKGFEIRTFAEHAPDLYARDRAELMALAEQGRVRPHVGAVYSLPQVVDALRLVESGTAVGKVVIDLT
jgi:NADPH2:quinone reductase